MGWSLISLAKTDPLHRPAVRLAMTEVLDGTRGESVAVLEDEITIDTAVDPIVAVLGAEIQGETEIATEMNGDDSLMNMSSKTIMLHSQPETVTIVGHVPSYTCTYLGSPHP